MDTKTGIIGGILVLAIVVGGVLWYMSEHPAPYVNQPNASSTPQVTATTATPLTLNESGKYYDIKASYPSSTSLAVTASTGADAQAVNTMKQFEVATIAAFKQQGNFDNLTPQDIKMLGLDQGNIESLEINYSAKSGPHTVSFTYTINEDTLGAHPNTTFRTFTFDAKTGAELSLSDLFAPGSDYLGVLSTVSRRMLPAIIARNENAPVANVDAGMISSGTTPDGNNFQNWYIDGANLVIIFAPYQVAPFSAGTQIMFIPLSQLSSVLNANYK